ncbi:ribosome-binding factor A [Patescibacteria group bacterium]|nr:ribosome-binding factor A [Patescibacteria group bacterium]MCG2694476.1 ribosome-binding factor A [Candidatus Parcubacteria bacterium]
MNLRQEKIKELLKGLAAQFLQFESNYTSLITVTDANASSDFKRATIFVTVYPESSEASALDFLKRKRKDFKKYAKTKVKMKTIPFFDFEIDKGEKNRQRIDELLKNN